MKRPLVGTMDKLHICETPLMLCCHITLSCRLNEWQRPTNTFVHLERGPIFLVNCQLTSWCNCLLLLCVWSWCTSCILDRLELYTQCIQTGRELYLKPGSLTKFVTNTPCWRRAKTQTKTQTQNTLCWRIAGRLHWNVVTCAAYSVKPNWPISINTGRLE